MSVYCGLPASKLSGREICSITNVAATAGTFNVWNIFDIVPKLDNKPEDAMASVSGSAFSLKRPGSDGRPGATSENHQIKVFWLDLLKRLG